MGALWFIVHGVFLLFLTIGIIACGGGFQNSSVNSPPSGGTTPTGESGGGSGGSTGNGSGGVPGGSSSGGGAESAATLVFVGSPPSFCCGPPTTPTANGSIAGFAVAADGSATQVPGSPFIGASNSIVASKKYLVATNGANLASYAISSNGHLTLVSTLNGTAHNDNPANSWVGILSMDRSGKTVYAGEDDFQGTDNNAFATFNLGTDGTMSFVVNSAVRTNYGGSLSFTTDNKFAYGHGCYFLAWDVYALARNADGMLSPLSSSVNSLPINDNNSYCPFSLAASASGFLAIVVGAEPSGATSIAVYKINADGSLTFVPNSLVSVDAGVIEFDPSGKYLGVGSSLSGTSMPGGVRIFQLSGTTLSPVGKVQNPETAFEVVKWDNSGHLYALSMESKSLFIYDVNQGVITPAPGSPHPVPSPGSLAVVPQ